VKPGLAQAGPLSSEAHARPDPACATEREHKRLLTRAQAQQLLERIADRAELEVHDPARPVEHTWTTYLDTDDLRFFASSRSALARRVRIRAYAASEAPADVPAFEDFWFLELKESAGGRRRKVRYRSGRAGIERVLRALRRGECPDPGDAALAELARTLAGAALEPRVCTVYRRLSLAAAPRVRVTLDEDVRFHLPRATGPTPEGASAPTLGAVPGVVVEVKGRGEIPAWLSGALEGFEALPDFSKFRLGFELLRTQGTARTGAVVGEIPLVLPAALRRRVVETRS
jgi:hypothetical protein